MLSPLLISERAISSTVFSPADMLSSAWLSLLGMHSTVLFILFIEFSFPVFLLVLFSRISISFTLPDFPPLQYGLNHILFQIANLFYQEKKKTTWNPHAAFHPFQCFGLRCWVMSLGRVICFAFFSFLHFMHFLHFCVSAWVPVGLALPSGLGDRYYWEASSWELGPQHHSAWRKRIIQDIKILLKSITTWCDITHDRRAE